MKATVSNVLPERKLVALIGAEGRGLFVRSNNNPEHCMMISPDGVGESYPYTIEHLFHDKGRTPVYEGDTVTLQF